MHNVCVPVLVTLAEQVPRPAVNAGAAATVAASLCNWKNSSTSVFGPLAEKSALRTEIVTVFEPAVASDSFAWMVTPAGRALVWFNKLTTMVAISARVTLSAGR